MDLAKSRTMVLDAQPLASKVIEIRYDLQNILINLQFAHPVMP